ncbi:MAG: type II toxin-antitoxin system RelB/DinJ family antitoxin [Muribaculaceae bacterium]|nr:type II toxin-antitoxin system RelB/DinJ family antitoxin [Muribaculaceae bacterium]
MHEANISIRLEKTLKERFCNLCSSLGLSTTSAITLFIRAALREKKIPFEIAVDENQEWREKAAKNFEGMRQSVANAGMQDLSLDEINAEIKAARKERRIQEGLDAFRQMREIVASSGAMEPTIDEINQEIKAVRHAIR